MDFNQLPNFLIIGAAKSGTTSLFDVIAQHPEVYASPKKEIRFFSNNDRFNNGVDWYQTTHFHNTEKYKIRSEATPAYLTWSEKVAPRIKELYGDHNIKFAAIFRDPVKRAYSHYWHRVRQGDEDPARLSFEEAIHTEEKRLGNSWQRLEYEGNGLFGYYRAGCYASRLKPYLDLFPRENFIFMLQEDLYLNFSSNMANLMRFLNIDDGYPLKQVVSNESTVPRDLNSYNLFNEFKKTKVKEYLKIFIPSKFRRWFRYKALLKPFNYPPMGNDIKVELYTHYEEEIRQLEKIIGRDLSHWKNNQ
jgi:hypothetical protein